ncbi:hypothetical protein PILCRDRAFT_8437 [Piloderma croceum F 1598]|uniref:Uncharacterized protein n=1 Tax=Piloderma croceum (strain F 1598) TaxID=765440 RepID=A0A0C3FRK6_PILCF|nr:hypothetical protein PILCRDRAFT_8437 [Piloderma croceum F 1598]
MQKDQQRACDRERQQLHRASVRDRKIANGWKPSQKHKHLEDVDETSLRQGTTAELSRPRRQYKEDRRAKRKSQGCKRDKQQQGAISKGVYKWHDSVLARVAAGNSPGGQWTRTGILEPYPDLRAKINKRLEDLRDSGVALSLMTIRGIMVAFIEHDTPHLFT